MGTSRSVGTGLVRSWACAASAVLLAVAAGCAVGSSQRVGTAQGEALRSLPLATLDGLPRTVGQVLDDSDATVFVFWSALCPCVRRYQERVDALAEAFLGRGVRVVGVSSNAGETPEQVRRALDERGARLEVLRDEGGLLAQAVGARTTPTVVLVDRRGVPLFHGWVDNERLPGDPSRAPWLEEAVTGFLERRPGPTSSKTFGCLITRRLGEPGGVCHGAVGAEASPGPLTTEGKP